jgi:predicted DNA-binding transcriptional regulator AlpA
VQLAHCPPFLLLVAVAVDGVTAMTTTTQAQPVARQLLNNDETADMLNVSRRTLPVWRVQGKGPKFIKIGKLVRYERTEIEAWILANTHANTSRQGAQSY